MRHISLPPLAIAFAVLAVGVGLQAQEPPTEEQMAAYLKAVSPNEHHGHMAEVVGTWDAEISIWQSPQQPEPLISTGTAEFSMDFGGRYLRQTFEGQFMGESFEGEGLSAYDNMTGEHVSIWVDSMGTGIMIDKGRCSEGGKVLETRGSHLDPMTGQTVQLRSVHRIEGPDRHVLRMYNTLPGGEEFKSMEIVYTRKKG